MTAETRARLLALLKLGTTCKHARTTKVPGGMVCDNCHAELRRR